MKTIALLIAIAAVLLGLNYLDIKFANTYIETIILLAGIYVILAVSLNLVNGFTGQFSLGHAGFFGIGAYVGTAVSLFCEVGVFRHWFDSSGNTDWLHGGIILVIAMLAGGLAAAMAGWIVGLPSLKLRGDYLAIVTLGFNQIIVVLLNNWNAMGGPRGFNGLTGGDATGLIPSFIWLSWCLIFICVVFLLRRQFDPTARMYWLRLAAVLIAGLIAANVCGRVVAFLLYALLPKNASVDQTVGFTLIPGLSSFFWVYLIAAVVIVVSINIRKSVHGLAFFSIREDEVAAEAMGVPTTRYKVIAFVLGAFFAGIAGVLFAHMERYIKPDQFNFIVSINIVIMVVLGGMGSVTGTAIGAILLTALPEYLRNVSPAVDEYRLVIFALLLIVLMLLRPQGIFGHEEFGHAWLAKQWMGIRTLPARTKLWFALLPSRLARAQRPPNIRRSDAKL